MIPDATITKATHAVNGRVVTTSQHNTSHNATMKVRRILSDVVIVRFWIFTGLSQSYVFLENHASDYTFPEPACNLLMARIRAVFEVREITLWRSPGKCIV